MDLLLNLNLVLCPRSQVWRLVYESIKAPGVDKSDCLIKSVTSKL